MQVNRLVLFVATYLISIQLNAAGLAGAFVLPFSEYQTWEQCPNAGWAPVTDRAQHQYHMEYYSNVKKYHMGEDWNGACGTNSDEKAPLYALADGKVVFLDTKETVPGQGKRLYIRYSFPYSYGMNGAMTFDSVYLHLWGVPSNITWTGSGTGTEVSKGSVVAYLGKSGTAGAHLHWEVQKDITLPLGTNPYQNPLTIAHALKYRAPSLIVDDRRDERSFTLSSNGTWYFFKMRGNAPSSTAYMVSNNVRKSLDQAITAGWLKGAQSIAFKKDDGKWYYYNDVKNNFFEDGKEYAIKSAIVGASLKIPVPRNAFQQDRARLDMLHAVENDNRFVSVKTETYFYDPDTDAGYDRHTMVFTLKDGRSVTVLQYTRKANPLLRYTNFYDPDLKKFVGWTQVNRNVLY